MFGEVSTIGQYGMHVLTRGEFLEQIERSSSSDLISDGLDVACKYVGAIGFLLVRNDGSEDFVVSSNWPYDFAKQFGAYMLQECAVPGQFISDYPAFEPKFLNRAIPLKIPGGCSENICILPLTCGDHSFLLSLLFEESASYSFDRLRDAALVSAYHIAEFEIKAKLENSYSELTEREMECLSWISRGKTSDEIALIIGISKNTVNNYITSIMNKTATKSRAEAVAEAVRSELI